MPSDQAPKSLVAVLGGSGFIGTRLVGRLAELGWTTRIGDLEPSAAFPALHFSCDVRQAPSLATPSEFHLIIRPAQATG